MRLKFSEQQQVFRGLDEALGAAVVDQCKLYLFGSRADDKKAGGDIDLLLICKVSIVEAVKDKKHICLSRIKKYLGDQRIDLLIRDSDQFQNADDFIESIRSELLLLEKSN